MIQSSITQTTNTVMMVRPINFKANPQTITTNAFQSMSSDEKDREVQDGALEEFNALVYKLRENGVHVISINDTPKPNTPDSIFPNNWVSTHEDGTVVVYPMLTKNRRAERRSDILHTLEEDKLFKIGKLVDLTNYENENLFLEGTGSMVLDRVNKIAYACLSARTDLKVLEDFGKQLKYKIVAFYSVDRKGLQIYHTNVMMSVGDKFAVVCLQSIHDLKERSRVVKSLKKTGHEIIEISYNQLYSFAGNMLQIRNDAGESLLVMSQQARDSLNEDQVSAIEKYARIVSSPLDIIEKHGGGSARCMLAEIHLPKIEKL